jgi:carbon storage regulator
MSLSAWESDTRIWLSLHEGYAAMLVLSRKKNESIVINNDITVTVVEIRGDKVRLGIVAPKEVPVHRQEVYEAIHGKPGGAEPPPATVAAKPQ